MDEGLRSWEKTAGVDRSLMGGLLSRKTSKKPDVAAVDERCGAGKAA